MKKVLILLDDLDDWKPYCSTNSIDTVSNYLQHKPTDIRPRLIINLSKDYSYKSEGYYSSLLAQARGDKPIPGVEVLNKLESEAGIRLDRNLQKVCYQWIQKHNISDNWTLNIYFGYCAEKGLEKVARYIFDNYPCPLLKVELNTKSRNQIDSVKSLAIKELTSEQEDFFADALDKFSEKIWRMPKSQKNMRYSLAILHNPEEKFPPSDNNALKKFLEIAKKMNIHAELITEEDSSRIVEFDALFIRTTTALNHYTFRLAQKATMYGLEVIDDPISIIRCTNKVYLNELLHKEKIATPLSKLIFRSNIDSFENIVAELGLPFVLKIPDGSFSVGMKKVKSENEYHEACKLLFSHSAILLAQEFTPTEYDWRIGVLNGEALYACKYYMAKGHWQIYNHLNANKSESGNVETIPIYNVPASILKTALKATSLIGKGLYGVDLKMVNNHPVVIEINDNPSIDHKLEDAILGDELYYRILNHFQRMIDQKHHER